MLISSFQLHAYDIYAGAHGGVAMMEDSEITDSTVPGVQVDLGFDEGLTASGVLGLRSDQYRSEVEFSYMKNDLDNINVQGLNVDPATIGLSGDVTALMGFVNAYYDFDLGNNIRPFVGAGVGFARIKADGALQGVPLDFSNKDTNFAWNAGAGIGYMVSEQVTLELRYRYISSSDPEFDTTTSTFASHNFTAGVRFEF
ncbi:MAG: outer membrane beta-barrel protein [Gammaproteobacteria bacterium]